MSDKIITSEELLHLLAGIIILGFCFSFREWGQQIFSISAGVQNWIIACGLVGISFFVHEAVHRYMATRYSAKVNFKLQWTAILVALLLVFLTNGWFVFAAIGVVSLSSVFFRPGYKKPHLGPYETAKIAVSGPLANILLAVFALLLFQAWPNPLLKKLMVINLWLGVINLFPFFRLLFSIFSKEWWTAGRLSLKPLSKRVYPKGLPYFEGELVFFGSRPLWFFAFTFSLAAAILLVILKNALAAALLALLIGLCIYFIWYYYFIAWAKPGSEKKTDVWWR